MSDMTVPTDAELIKALREVNERQNEIIQDLAIELEEAKKTVRDLNYWIESEGGSHGKHVREKKKGEGIMSYYGIISTDKIESLHPSPVSMLVAVVAASLGIGFYLLVIAGIMYLIAG